MTEPAYRMATVAKRRVRIVEMYGAPGYVVRWTSRCSGCSDEREGVSSDVGAGCSECGYTGKSRQAHWIPLDPCSDCGSPKTGHSPSCSTVALAAWPHPAGTPVWVRLHEDAAEIATATTAAARVAGESYDVIVFVDLPPGFVSVGRVRLREIPS